ncbi:major facilitator family transporter [Flexivirga endophytica]|uniref:Major facilitator family transporter n=1 Tax=Flexivirga endophytica TaxID=1849103 RepID=A0A916T1I0_9MICO|nr:MFS transporter [Flexivirga endophytica]GGB24701.1 major facilitator family transporter [Flexivirga endophytica]GHB63409.1 major facilitator family transporter [Flexivirga endophytica]
MRIPGWLRVAFAMFVVGWGANQFTPLLLVYRATDHYSQTLVTSMFAAYVLGLVPALLIAAELGGRFGHRKVLRPVMVLTILASLLLAIGDHSPAPLFIGRVLYGVCTGAAMAPGTTWVKELSADAPVGTGARRAAIALSAGFGGGAFLVGFMAQWLPAPKVLPYVVHIALTVVAAVLVWNAPVPERAAAVRTRAGNPTQRDGRHYALSGHFWSRIGPMAPWVFACPAMSMVILPTLIKDEISGAAVAFTGLLCGLTLGTGVLVQQPARRLESLHPGLVTVLGMASTLLGVLLTALTVGHGSVTLVIVASVVLGAGYGLNLVGGLSRVEHIAPAGELAMTNAVFYSLTYVGFAVPTAVSVLVDRWPETDVLLGLAVVAVLSLGAGVLAQRAARPATV